MFFLCWQQQHSVVTGAMKNTYELRSARVAAEIPATLLAAKAEINRSRLSAIERGYIPATDDELNRLNQALEQLLKAKSVIQQAAASVGWPQGGRTVTYKCGTEVAPRPL